MYKSRVAFLIGVVLSVSLMGLGCNPFQKTEEKVSQKIGESVAESMLEKATGGKVDVDTGNNQVVFKDNKTGNITAFGEDLKLPDNFPKDVPIYSGVKITSVIMDEQGDKAVSLSLKSTDNPVAVLGWYEKAIKDAGWDEQTSWSANNIESRTYDKDKSHIALTVSKNTENENGSVILLVKTVDDQEVEATDEEE
ncbi:MAG: hypothetical protein ABIB04_04300 [Patescibacteria group bacterium]